MERVVIDTNCLLQIIPRRSAYNPLWQAIRHGRYSMCVTTEILEEYDEILSRLASPDVARVVIEAIINNPRTEFITPYFHFELIKVDVDDNKFVDCAIIGGAKFIVTEDKHYDVVKKTNFPVVNVIGLDDFMQELEKT